jgi:hypothetical protein
MLRGQGYRRPATATAQPKPGGGGVVHYGEILEANLLLN